MYSLYRLNINGAALLRGILDYSQFNANECTDMTIRDENKLIDISDDILNEMFRSGEIFRFTQQFLREFDTKNMYLCWDLNGNDDLLVKVLPVGMSFCSAHDDEITVAIWKRKDDE